MLSGQLHDVAYGVSVPIGTPVLVRLNRRLVSDPAQVGKTIQCSVAADVTVDGKVVIRSGTQASGVMTEAKKRRMFGAPAELTIAVTTVTAVDGSLIPVNGSLSTKGQRSQLDPTGGLVHSDIPPPVLVGIVIGSAAYFLVSQIFEGNARIQAGVVLRVTTAASVDVLVP